MPAMRGIDPSAILVILKDFKHLSIVRSERLCKLKSRAAKFLFAKYLSTEYY